jgi:hypothetical protein
LNEINALEVCINYYGIDFCILLSLLFFEADDKFGCGGALGLGQGQRWGAFLFERRGGSSGSGCDPGLGRAGFAPHFLIE